MGMNSSLGPRFGSRCLQHSHRQDLDNLSNEQAAHLVLHFDEFVCVSTFFVLCGLWQISVIIETRTQSTIRLVFHKSIFVHYPEVGSTALERLTVNNASKSTLWACLASPPTPDHQIVQVNTL
jgi:hypothetical protein